MAAFAMLGAWYLECAKDRSRALKCYERAVAIDPTSVSNCFFSFFGLFIMSMATTLSASLHEARKSRIANALLPLLDWMGSLRSSDHSGAEFLRFKQMLTQLGVLACGTYK